MKKIESMSKEIECFSKVGDIKNKMELLELKNAITEIKKYLSGWAQKQNSCNRKRINELEDKKIKITQLKQQREYRLKRKNKNMTELRDLWKYNKWSNICIIRVKEGKEREGMAKKVLGEIMSENSPNLAKDLNL